MKQILDEETIGWILSGIVAILIIFVSLKVSKVVEKEEEDDKIKKRNKHIK